MQVLSKLDRCVARDHDHREYVVAASKTQTSGRPSNTKMAPLGSWKGARYEILFFIFCILRRFVTTDS